MAMAQILEQLGKEVLVVNADPTPPKLEFLDPERRIKVLGADATVEQLDAYEVLMVLDTSAWSQLGDMADVVRTTAAVKIVLDHHVSSDDLGAESFSESDAEAAGRLVIDAADALSVQLSPEIAGPVFVALATDTGWFRFSSTTGDTLRAAARLLDTGIRPDEIFRRLYEDNRLARLKLVGRTTARIETDMHGRLVHSHIGMADFEAVGALSSDSEDIINTILSVGGAEVAVLLVEQSTGGYKISFRSRSALDCAAVAEQFGGGGHKKAAGASLDGPLSSARQKVLDAVREAMA